MDYHVSVHTAIGYRYASTQRFVVNPEDDSKKYHHIHWGRLDEMEEGPILQIYYRQYVYTYDVKSNGASIKKGLLKINLYLDPVRRGSELVYLDSEIKLQEKELKTRISEQTACKDDAS